MILKIASELTAYVYKQTETISNVNGIKNNTRNHNNTNILRSRILEMVMIKNILMMWYN